MILRKCYILFLLASMASVSVAQKTDRDYLRSGNKLYKDSLFIKAEVDYRKALEINPNFAQAYHERGRVKLAKGDKQRSMGDMKKAIELAPENGASINGEYNNFEQQKNIPF